MVFKNFLKLLKKTFRFKKKSPRRKTKKVKRRKLHKPFCKTRKVSRPKARKIRVKKIKKAKAVKKPKIEGKDVGVVTHYFPNVSAAVVKLRSPLALGDVILVRGRHREFRQTVGSMQIDRKPIERAKKGQEIGLEIFKPVYEGDIVYRLNITE